MADLSNAVAQDAWTQGIPTDPSDPKNAAWNAYDLTIQDAVRTYDGYLTGKGGYTPGVTLNWLMIKAMCWTETGPGTPEWKVRPAQIGIIKGNVADPGIIELLSGKPKCVAILPPEYAPGGKQRISLGDVGALPAVNIRAGIGYLLLRAANTGLLSTLPPGTSTTPYKVVPGDNLSRIAANVGTTLPELKLDNPAMKKNLMPGDILQYKPASEHIVSWKTIDPEFVAATYNANDIPTYKYRIGYCLSILQGKKK